MIRVTMTAAGRSVVLQCDQCSSYFIHGLRTPFNLPNMHEARVLRRAARKRGWQRDVDLDQDLCPTCAAPKTADHGPLTTDQA